MNISLAGAKKRANKKGSIGYGLNKRGSSAKGISDAFGESSSSEDESSNPQHSSNQKRVNQQIAKEQDALRKRAQAASTLDASVYDYDGAYDSFKPNETEAVSSGKEERKSRYIGDLLKAAKKRERERDERKVAKEQAEEDLQADFQGKEKFVTRAYKRKLEERKQWELEGKRNEREEEQNDVTKKVAGAAFASFYGNFNRNVAVGGAKEEGKSEEQKTKQMDEDNDLRSVPHERNNMNTGFLGGFERADETNEPNDKDSITKAPALSLREMREKKVMEARSRYLERKSAALKEQ